MGKVIGLFLLVLVLVSVAYFALWVLATPCDAAGELLFVDHADLYAMGFSEWEVLKITMRIYLAIAIGVC